MKPFYTLPRRGHWVRIMLACLPSRCFRPLFLSLLFAATTAVVAGCGPSNHYEIEMRTDGASLERTLRLSRPGATSLEKSEIDHLTAIYADRQFPPEVLVHTFNGRFTHKTPDDVGGAGSLTTFDSQMGSLSAYVERFRGNDDQYAEIMERRKAVNQLVDLLVGWLDTESGDDEKLAALCTFLDGPFRSDVQNLVVLAWQFEMVAHYIEAEQAISECLLRLGQYLTERGYFEPDEVPRFFRVFHHPDLIERDEHLLELVRTVLVSKAGLTDEQQLLDMLSVLADTDELQASFDRYVRSTEAYRELYEQWVQQRKAGIEEDEPTSSGMLDEMIGVAFPRFKFFEVDDQLEVKLAVQTRPFLTNGQWDEETNRVTWNGEIEVRGETYHDRPTVYYAFWSVPDTAFQKAHFGKVALEGSDLAQYCLWRNGLTEAEAAEWDPFLTGLSPESAEDQIEAFRFLSEKYKTAEESQSLADEPRQLIRNGLKR